MRTISLGSGWLSQPDRSEKSSGGRYLHHAPGSRRPAHNEGSNHEVAPLFSAGLFVVDRAVVKLSLIQPLQTKGKESEDLMSYRVTTYGVLQANLSAAGTTLMLCRANIGRIDLSEEEKADTLWRIERQIAELEGMRLELTRPAPHKRCAPTMRKPHLRPVD